MKHNFYLSLLAFFLITSCGKKEVESKSKIKEESILEFKDQDIKLPIDTYFRNF